MAKTRKKSEPKYIKSPSAKGDLYLDKKYDLSSDLDQKDLDKLYKSGFTDIVLKIEG